MPTLHPRLAGDWSSYVVTSAAGHDGSQPVQSIVRFAALGRAEPIDSGWAWTTLGCAGVAIVDRLVWLVGLAAIVRWLVGG